MLTKRPASERGHANHGWLDTHHTFSFAQYYDPEHMGFRSLRVINDDIVAAGAGFPTHAHDDMEIITYVLEGALEHRDSTGTGSVLRAGDVQHMTAGSGIRHSEFNPSPEETLRLLQIWIHPDRKGLEPAYQERHFDEAGKQGKLRPIASGTSRDGALPIHQDVGLFASILAEGQRVEHRLAPGRHAWVQVATGTIRANGVELSRGDGLAVSGEEAVTIEGRGEGGEFLLFDLA